MAGTNYLNGFASNPATDDERAQYEGVAMQNGMRSGNLLVFTVSTTGERSMFVRHRVEVTP